MPAAGRSYIIAGAGISGLTLALSLARLGAKVSVLERSHAVQEFGAGLQISPNARRLLDRLGLAGRLDGIGLEPKALDLYAHGQTRPLQSLELGDVMGQRFGAPYAVMHRADLAEALYAACRASDKIEIIFGVQDWRVTDHGHGVTAAFEPGGEKGGSLKADAFIGADGVHSQTRRTLLSGPAAQFGNRIAWRTLVNDDALAAIIAADRVSVFFGTGFHLVCYPLPHRRQVNLALFLPSDRPETSVQPALAAPGPGVAAIMAAAGPDWTPWPLYTVETPKWHKGNIGLVGDAAHAMVPFQAQGAAMGIEDAVTLATLLVETKSTETAFQSYERLRQERVGKVAALSARNGRIFHMPWPLSLTRDGVIRAQGPRGHLERLKWIYDFDASAPKA